MIFCPNKINIRRMSEFLEFLGITLLNDTDKVKIAVRLVNMLHSYSKYRVK